MPFAKIYGIDTLCDDSTDFKLHFYSMRNRNNVVDTHNELKKAGTSDEKLWKS